MVYNIAPMDVKKCKEMNRDQCLCIIWHKACSYLVLRSIYEVIRSLMPYQATGECGWVYYFAVVLNPKSHNQSSVPSSRGRDVTVTLSHFH